MDQFVCATKRTFWGRHVRMNSFKFLDFRSPFIPLGSEAEISLHTSWVFVSAKSRNKRHERNFCLFAFLVFFLGFNWWVFFCERNFEINFSGWKLARDLVWSKDKNPIFWFLSSSLRYRERKPGRNPKTGFMCFEQINSSLEFVEQVLL